MVYHNVRQGFFPLPYEVCAWPYSYTLVYLQKYSANVLNAVQKFLGLKIRQASPNNISIIMRYVLQMLGPTKNGDIVYLYIFTFTNSINSI